MLKYQPLKVYRRSLHYEKHNEVLYIDIGYAPIFIKLWMEKEKTRKRQTHRFMVRRAST